MENNITILSIVQRIFSNWTALRMAVEHGMGRPDQAQDFCEYVHQMLAMNEELHHSDIAIELEDYMDTEFNTKLEDNSGTQVAEEILRFHRYILQNDLAMLDSELAKLSPLQPWITTTSVPKVSTIKVDDSDDMPNSKMQVDEEGFTLIRRKK